MHDLHDVSSSQKNVHFIIANCHSAFPNQYFQILSIMLFSLPLWIYTMSASKCAMTCRVTDTKKSHQWWGLFWFMKRIIVKQFCCVFHTAPSRLQCKYAYIVADTLVHSSSCSSVHTNCAVTIRLLLVLLIRVIYKCSVTIRDLFYFCF